MHKALEEALRNGGGVASRTSAPPWAISRAARAGQLVGLLPGVYCRAGDEDLLAVRVLAANAAYPGGILIGRAAAALTWWPELRVPTIELATDHQRHPAPGYRLVRRRVPAENVSWMGELPVADPAITVLDLIPELGGRAIDEGLRRRATAMSLLWEALARTRGRRGNKLRAALLDDSRDEPWSEAERAFHRILRTCRLPCDWVANHLVTDGVRRFYLDAALPALKLAFEIDGYEFHGDRTAFERDRRRDVTLARLGWRVIRFSAAQVLGEPDAVAAAVTEIVRRARQAA